jgi:hypothetical protein
MKSANTPIAICASVVFKDSAGLWLMPPLQRTNSIATGQMVESVPAS